MLVFLLAQVDTQGVVCLKLEGGSHYIKLELGAPCFQVEGPGLVGRVGDTIKVLADGDLVVRVPTWPVSVRSTSGDLSVVSLEGPTPDSLDVSVFSGDVYLEGPFPGRVRITTLSGAITIGGEVRGEAGWEGAKYDLQSASGPIHILSPLPCLLTVNSLGGSLVVELEGAPKSGFWNLRTSGGVIRAFFGPDTLSGDFTYRSNGFEAVARVLGMPGETKELFGIPVSPALSPYPAFDYTKATGLSLGLGLEYGSAGSPLIARVSGAWDMGRGGPRWVVGSWVGFARKPDLYLGVFLFDTTATPDPWYPSGAEGALGAFLFGYDPRVHYGKRGLWAGLRAVSGPLELRGGLLSASLYSLPGVKALTLMGPGLADNPPIREGALRAFDLSVEYANPGAILGVWYVGSATRDSFNVRTAGFWLRLARESWRWGLRLRAGGAWLVSGEASLPFLWSVGGLGTVPGAPDRAQEGAKALWAGVSYVRKLYGVLPGEVGAFGDLGSAWDGEPEPMADLGLSVKVYGLTLGIAQELTGAGEGPRVFVRIK